MYKSTTLNNRNFPTDNPVRNKIMNIKYYERNSKRWKTSLHFCINLLDTQNIFKNRNILQDGNTRKIIKISEHFRQKTK